MLRTAKFFSTAERLNRRSLQPASRSRRPTTIARCEGWECCSRDQKTHKAAADCQKGADVLQPVLDAAKAYGVAIDADVTA